MMSHGKLVFDILKGIQRETLEKKRENNVNLEERRSGVAEIKI